MNAQVAPKIFGPRGRAPTHRAKAAWIAATDRSGGTLWRGSSDSTMTRMHWATGEALLALFEKSAEKGTRITGNTGKSGTGERVTDGSVVAEKRSNVRGAKGPCCL